MTVSLHNRRKLEMAIRRLLDSTVTRPETKLTWKNVAVVAGVSKATADRAIDLRNEFRQQIEERVPLPTTCPQPGLRSRGNADEELARLRREHTELKLRYEGAAFSHPRPRPGEPTARPTPST